jgi:hypothetical protein
MEEYIVCCSGDCDFSYRKNYDFLSLSARCGKGKHIVHHLNGKDTSNEYKRTKRANNQGAAE